MIRVDRITNDYGGSHPAIVNLQFCIQPGSVTVMVGTTGSGKSTLLRVLAGLEVPMSGVIRWDSGSNPPFGILFQEPRRMPWLNVRQNVKFGFGPKRRQESGRLERRSFWRTGYFAVQLRLVPCPIADGESAPKAQTQFCPRADR
jgi:ABC-type nitrate/sulfonate/bicarbonate transport system ATPase subunit